MTIMHLIMKWSGRTYWLSRGLRSILLICLNPSDECWWVIIMHVQSYNLALQTQMTSFRVKGVYIWQVKFLHYQMGIRAMFWVDLPSQVNIGDYWIIVSLLCFIREWNFCWYRLVESTRLIGQLWGPRSATRSISQPPPPPHQWATKITAQHPPQTTKLHLKRHLLLLFTLAPLAAHSVCLKDT